MLLDSECLVAHVTPTRLSSLVSPADDETTYWKIPAAGAYSWVAFDLGSEYTLTGLRLAGWYSVVINGSG